MNFFYEEGEHSTAVAGVLDGGEGPPEAPNSRLVAASPNPGGWCPGAQSTYRKVLDASSRLSLALDAAH